MAERTPAVSGSEFPGLVISNVIFTDTILGKGADATVHEVDCNGTVCAAKRLHEALLENQSPGGVANLIGNFEAECLTWSKLRHPGVVQFLGVYLESSSRLPVLIMEKMDTSLRTHLENHSKEEFPLDLKAFVLRQVTQALAYLHNQDPPLVHHGLNTNNVLLNVVSFVAKVSDFGMSRAINPSLQKVPMSDTKLDVFSFGNTIIFTLTHGHDWPELEAPAECEDNLLVALNRLQRRQKYTELFSPHEKELFLPVVSQCLENRPDKRPSSVMLVTELRRIESIIPRRGQVPVPIGQHCQQLSSCKAEQCRYTGETLQLRGMAEAFHEATKALQEKRVAMEEKDAARESGDMTLSDQKKLQRTCTAMKQKGSTAPGMGMQLVATQKVKHPLRDMPRRKLGKRHLKVIKHSREGGWYGGIAVNSDEGLLAVTDTCSACVHLFTKNGAFVRSIGEGVVRSVYGIAFDLKGNIWVTDWVYCKVVKLSQDGRLLQTIHHAGSGSDCFSNPYGVSVSPEGLVYICDHGNHRVTVHDEAGKFLFAFGSKGSGPGCFRGPGDIAFGSDGLMYVTDDGNKSVCVWSKEGTFKRDFKPKYIPTCIAATSDNHLLITSLYSKAVMDYTLEGELVHDESGEGYYHTAKFNGPRGICVYDNSVVCVADKDWVRVFDLI